MLAEAHQGSVSVCQRSPVISEPRPGGFQSWDNSGQKLDRPFSLLNFPWIYPLDYQVGSSPNFETKVLQ